ncbi:excinuclease Cho [Luteimonas sp. 3794]|uniref:excinuclease Cho n=1 Tax=Luteimonas sp. 3794 TaxID=2817730 RepID=UPI00285DB61F|nr:excinuclease Cho [Luteimonas sp. 3794]MDR6992451.1 excinuclease Cho [Luteimonas sp. 3794]
MRPVRDRRREAAALYEYPEHLRPEIDALPRAPGVYTFMGPEDDVLPLYIGKSIDIRGRVMDHFRTPEEARLLRQSRRISHIRTAGDIGAQLLEAQMIKATHPLYNRKLRRTTRQFSIALHLGKVTVVNSAEIDPARAPVLYGLHSSPRAAMTALRRLADENRLCYTLLGIERGTPGRPCFRAMLKQCAGACHGGETVGEHEERLRLVLEDRQVAAWPFNGAIALEERGTDMRQYHVVRDWQYLGSATTLTAARRIRGSTGQFDRDAYRILRAPVFDGAHRIVPLVA